MRIDEILATRRRARLLVRVLPAQDRRGRANLRHRARVAARSSSPTSCRSPTGAGGSTRDRTVELTKWIKQELGIEAMAHLSCVGATRDELREILDDIADAGIENVLALRGDPPRGETEWTPHPGGLRYSTELAALIADAVRVLRRRPPASRRSHPEAPDLAQRPALPQAEGRQRRLVPDHAAVLRQRALLPVRRGGARGRDRGPDPARDHADHRPAARSRRSPGCAARRSRRRCSRRSSGARTIPDAVLQLGVSYATLQCAELLARGAPGIHFYTLNRSPATRAILSALQAAAARGCGARSSGRRSLISSAWATVGSPVELVADVDLVVALVGPDPPEAEEPRSHARASGETSSRSNSSSPLETR